MREVVAKEALDAAEKAGQLDFKNTYPILPSQ
jgi:hypothetical protein